MMEREKISSSVSSQFRLSHKIQIKSVVRTPARRSGSSNPLDQASTSGTLGDGQNAVMFAISVLCLFPSQFLHRLYRNLYRPSAIPNAAPNAIPNITPRAILCSTKPKTTPVGSARERLRAIDLWRLFIRRFRPITILW